MSERIEFPDLKPEVLAAGNALCDASVSGGLVEGYLYHPNNRRGLAAFLREAVYQAFPVYKKGGGTHPILDMANNLHSPPPPEAQEDAFPVHQVPDYQGIGLTPSSSVYVSPAQWPEPITDRRPTIEDADEGGQVQYINGGKHWYVCHYTVVPEDRGWFHAPTWTPKPQLTNKQKALAILYGTHTASLSPQELDIIRAALS